MIEIATFEEATVEKLAEAHVIMTVGWGDSQAPKVLIGRKQFITAAESKAKAEETTILRVKIETAEELEELKSRVKEAKGELDPGAE